jgi:hypothetical protein
MATTVRRADHEWRPWRAAPLPMPNSAAENPATISVIYSLLGTGTYVPKTAVFGTPVLSNFAALFGRCRSTRRSTGNDPGIHRRGTCASSGMQRNLRECPWPSESYEQLL